MRPIHALILLVVLAAVLAGAFLLVRSDSHAPGIAPPLQEAANGARPATEAPTVLEPAGAAPLVRPGGERAPSERSLTETTSSTATSAGVRGRVVDDAGRPVAGATVYASSSDLPFGLGLDAPEADLPFFQRKQTTTGADGRFQLEPATKSSVRLAVRADGFAPFNAQKPVAGARADVGDLVLERGVVLQGRVVDASGMGVANAELVDAPAPQDAGFLAFSTTGGRSLARTDAGGNFRVDRLAVGPWSLRVVSDAHPDKRESGTTERSGEVVANLVFTLEAGFEIEGRVLGGPSAGFGDLRVVAQEKGGGDELFDALSPHRRAQIAPDGSFRVRGCTKEKEYKLSVRTVEHGMLSRSHSDAVTAKSGDRDVVLTWRSETAIVARVVDAESGLPIEELHVSAGYRWPIPLQEEGTGRSKTRFPGGVLRYAPVRGGSGDDAATLKIEAVGHAPFERSDLRLVPGIDNDLGLIRLERSAIVRVTVVEAASGKPVANATVTLEAAQAADHMEMSFSVEIEDGGAPDFGGPGGARRAKTDREGRAQVSSLPKKRATLRVRHKDYAEWKSDPLDLPEQGDTELTARLLAGATVEVVVQDGNGRRVPGLTIDHRDAQRSERMFFPGQQGDDVTDAEGRVLFAHLTPGKHHFRVRASGGGGSVALADLVQVAGDAGGEPAEPDAEKGWRTAAPVEGEKVTLVLDAPDLGQLSGRVREGGKPLPGAKVRLAEKRGADPFGMDLDFLPGGQGLSATTNAAGEYAFQDAVAGEYRVIVTHQARAMKWEGEIEVLKGDTRFDVELPLATLEGRVTTEDGKPVEGAQVGVERFREPGGGRGMFGGIEANVVMIGASDGGEEMFSFGGPSEGPTIKTDAEGRYRLRGVTPDVPLQVTARGKEFQPRKSDKLQVGRDEVRVGVDLVLLRGGAIEVLVQHPDGRAVSGVVVRAEPQFGEKAPKTGFTGLEGRASLTGLAPGRWKVTCERAAFEPGAEGASAAPREVTVAPGRTEKITVELPK